MADKKDKQEENSRGVPTPEKKIPSGEDAFHFGQERRPEGRLEKKEISPDDKIISAELMKEVEMMKLDENTKKDAEAKAEKIEFLGEKEKIERLLKIAREKGVVFAIQVVKKMNEPYLLDILHDTLAQEGLYKKVGQSTDDDDDNKK